jgi:hypothetical protein
MVTQDDTQSLWAATLGGREPAIQLGGSDVHRRQGESVRDLSGRALGRVHLQPGRGLRALSRADLGRFGAAQAERRAPRSGAGGRCALQPELGAGRLRADTNDREQRALQRCGRRGRARGPAGPERHVARSPRRSRSLRTRGRSSTSTSSAPRPSSSASRSRAMQRRRASTLRSSRTAAWRRSPSPPTARSSTRPTRR